MGNTMAKVRLCNPRDTGKCLELELLVDTGSTYTWIKSSRLRELGIEPTTRWRFRTIEGRIIERDIGEALIECMGERATTIVVFAQENDAEVLGVYSLEGLRLEVDPITKQLKKTEALLAV
ncbi:aspartyl protease [Vulcanisaeta distributa]|uniref:aspartyl protease n=1 Tax=Vulcanisaeta distributa TaxID=164451 RepID=UPI000AEC6E3B|nr:aspartyl protease [Vulcanisaeta distributa]